MPPCSVTSATYLSLQGYTAVEASEDQADVLTSSAPRDLQAATKLMFEIGIWRAKHGSVEVSVDPDR